MRILSLVAVLLVWGIGAPSAWAQTWVQQPSGTARTLRAVAFLSTTKVVAVGDKDGGDFTAIYSSDGGSTWNPAAAAGTAKNLLDVAFSGATGIAVGQGGTVLQSLNSGQTWTDRTGATGKDLYAVAISGSNVVAVGTKAGGSKYTILRSDNGGNTWTAINPAATNDQDLNAVAFLSPSVVIAVGDKQGAGNFTILRSDNAGLTWAEINPAGTAKNLNAIAFSGSTVLAVGDKAGGGITILRSTNAGLTWSQPTFPGAAKNLNDVAFLDASTAVAVGDKDGAAFTVLRSTNGGADWVAPSLPGGGQNLEALDTKQSFAIAVGNAGTVVASEDGGASWLTQATGSGAGLIDVAVINPVIVVGSGGEVLLSGDQPSATTSAGVLGFEGILVLEEEPVDVPFGSEWVVALLVLASGLWLVRR